MPVLQEPLGRRTLVLFSFLLMKDERIAQFGLTIFLKYYVETITTFLNTNDGQSPSLQQFDCGVEFKISVRMESTFYLLHAHAFAVFAEEFDQELYAGSHLSHGSVGFTTQPSELGTRLRSLLYRLRDILCDWPQWPSPDQNV